MNDFTLSHNQSRDLILKLFEVIVLKFKSIANYQVTYLLESNTTTTTNTNSITTSITNSSSSSSSSSNSNSISSSSSTSSSVKVEITNNTSLPAAIDKSESDIVSPILQDKKAYIEKLDSFINAFDDKDRVKVNKILFK